MSFPLLVEALPDAEFTKTFFSSTTRRLFGTVGVAPEIEFVATDLDPLGKVTTAIGTNTYLNHGSLLLLFEDVLGDVRFHSAWRDFDRSVAHVASEVTRHLKEIDERRAVIRVEIIRPVFYQVARAYIVGRIVGRDFLIPLVIALKNTDGGVLVDAVMLSEADVSIVFSFTKSYFHVDLDRVGEAVLFLKSVLPRKPVSELFTVLGRAKQGKTERYRELMRHLEQTAGQVRARSRRARPRHGVLHPALVRCGLQDHSRQVPLPQERAARGGEGQIPTRVQARSRRAAGGCAGVQATALPQGAVCAGAVGRVAYRDGNDGPRGRR